MPNSLPPWFARWLKAYYKSDNKVLGYLVPTKTYCPQKQRDVFVGLLEVHGNTHTLHREADSSNRLRKLKGYTIQAAWFEENAKKVIDDIVIYGFSDDSVTMRRVPFARWRDDGVRYDEGYGVQVCFPDTMLEREWVQVKPRKLTRKQIAKKAEDAEWADAKARISHGLAGVCIGSSSEG
jgi:hypothetical protein